MNRAALLEAVAERWNREDLLYTVTHGIEGYPARVGRDLDVLVSRCTAARAIDLAQETLESKGLEVVRPAAIWGERIVAGLPRVSADLLEVHAVEALEWGPARLAANPVPDRRVGPFPVDPWPLFAKRVLLPLLSGDAAKAAAALAADPLNATDVAAICVRVSDLCGPRLATALSRRIADADVGALKGLAPALCRTLKRRAWLRSPFIAVRRTAAALWRRLRQPFSPCAPVICIVGPPGSGKSALADALSDGDRTIFTGVVRSKIAVWPEALHVSGATHWARVVILLARGLGRALADRLHSSRQRLVIHEGSLLEPIVSPNRCGLRSAAGVRACWRIVPRPDLVVLLDVPAEAIVAGRPGMPEAQAAADRARWRALVGAMPHGVVLDGSRSMPELRAQCARFVAEAFLARNRRTPVLRRGAAHARI